MSGNLEEIMGGSFNPNDVPESNYDPLPDGEYVVEVVAADLMPTSTGGQRINMRYEVITGAKQGRNIFENLNVVNSNEKAQLIAYQTLAKICKAIGIEKAIDTNDFIGKRMIVKTKIEEGKDGYGPKNKVTAYAPVSGSQTTQRSAPSAPDAPTSSGTAKKLAWHK